jgi:hypothetical protein
LQPVLDAKRGNGVVLQVHSHLAKQLLVSSSSSSSSSYISSSVSICPEVATRSRRKALQWRPPSDPQPPCEVAPRIIIIIIIIIYSLVALASVEKLQPVLDAKRCNGIAFQVRSHLAKQLLAPLAVRYQLKDSHLPNNQPVSY